MSIWPGAVASNDDLFIAVNSLDTTLPAGIDSSVTTIVVASTANFPPIGGIIIDNEVIFYTSVSGNTLLGCIRGSDGTTAVAHAATAPVANGVIAFHHNGVKDEIISIETYLNLVLGSDTAVVATEFETLVGITSNIQVQLDSKAPSFLAGDISTTTTGITIGSGDNSTVGPNVTVDIDTADATRTGLLLDTDWSTFNNKQDALGYTPVPNTRTVNGHALSADVTVTKSDIGLGNVDNTSDANKPVSTATQTALDLKKNITTGNAYKFETTDASGNLQETTVTASRAVATDANGLPTASAVTSTELGYLTGVTSAIQTQLNTKATDSLVVHLAGTETITGAKTFQSSSLKLQEVSSTDVVTIAVASLVASHTYTIPDAGTNSSFLLTEGAQTVNNTLTWNTGAIYTFLGSPSAPGLALNGVIKTSGFSGGSGGENIIISAAGVQAMEWSNVSGVKSITVASAFPLNLSSPTSFGSLTASTVPYLDASNVVTSSSVTPTELGYLSGVTSAIQTQLNAKATDSLVVHLAGTESITGAKTFSAQLIPSAGIKGISTNTNATAGNVGEYIESVVGPVSGPASTQYNDVTSITLSAGDWDVTGIVTTRANGAVFTSTDIEGGISTTSGNSGTGLVTASNAFAYITSGVFTTGAYVVQSIPSYRMSLTGSTVVYLKSYIAAYTSGTPQNYGRLSARRVQPGT